MRNLKTTGLMAVLMMLALVSPALPHHSHAMFDHAREVSVNGTVTQFVFRNPHVFLYIDVKNEKAETVNYWIEMSNLSNTIQRGISQSTFKPGDIVSAKLHPLIDGRPGGSYVTIT